MSNNRIKKSVSDIFKEVQQNLISEEEDEIFKKVAERLNVSYENHKTEEEKEKKKPQKKRVVTLDSETVTFANQALLLRAILSNEMAQKESLSAFIKNLVREEWKRLFSMYENIHKEIEKEEKKKNNRD
jgi:hypothetical protein